MQSEKNYKCGNCGTIVEIIIPLAIPTWWTSKISYSHNTYFIIVTDDMHIISEWQKIFLYIDNPKFYFTELESALRYIETHPTYEILLITTTQFYSQITQQDSYKLFKNTF